MRPETPAGPADTSMMRIVHAALRRDLARGGRGPGPAAAPATPSGRRCAGTCAGWPTSCTGTTSPRTGTCTRWCKRPTRAPRR